MIQDELDVISRTLGVYRCSLVAKRDVISILTHLIRTTASCFRALQHDVTMNSFMINFIKY